MNYTFRIYKRQSEPLYAIWIDVPEAEPQPGTVWKMMQAVEITTEGPIPTVLCGLLLMSETTSDHLFRQIADTWLGPVEDDPLNNYDRYTSQQETAASLDKTYLD